jgi:type I restriction enzyme M protein
MVNAAMRKVETHNPQLAGVLHKTFNLFTGTLLKELLKKISKIPATLDFNAFGHIYKYILDEFAMSEAAGRRRVLYARQHRAVALAGDRTLPQPCPRPRLLFGRHLRAVGVLGGRAPKNSAAEVATCGVYKTDKTGRHCHKKML